MNTVDGNKNRYGFGNENVQDLLPLTKMITG